MKKLLNLALALAILFSLISPATLPLPARAAPYQDSELYQIAEQPLTSDSIGIRSANAMLNGADKADLNPSLLYKEGGSRYIGFNSIVQPPFASSDEVSTPESTPPKKPPVEVKKEKKEIKPQGPARREITLITGDKVVVSVDETGKARGYAIKPANPNKMGQSFSTLKIQGDTYIIPRDLDMKRFDRELFNIDRLLRDDYDKEKNFPILIDLKPALPTSTAQALSTGLQSLSASVKELKAVNTFSARLLPSSLPSAFQSLATDNRIEKVWLDKKVKVDLSQSVPQIGAPQLWGLVITGTGQRIAILDTGIDATHPGLDDLDDNPATSDPKVVQQVHFTDDPGVADLHGHGTHVAGIAAGTGAGDPYPFAPSPAHAWWSSKGDNLNNILQRSVNLTGLTHATLAFNTFYNLETNWDFGYVEISKDGGSTWIELARYNGNSGSFVPRSISLTPHVGGIILLRFRMTTDSSFFYDGWFLDDISVTGVFSDDVEAGPGGWTPTGWSIIEARRHNGAHTWFSGSSNNLQNSLQRSFNLSGLAYATLTFLTRYDTEPGWDYGMVQVSTNNGVSWTNLDSYNGNSGPMGFVRKTYSLNPYVGLTNVLIRFYYFTDSSVIYPGWWVDDISIPQLGFLDNVETGNTGWSIINTGPPEPAWNIASFANKGVAPGSLLWNVKVLNRFGEGYESWVISGIDYARLGPDGTAKTGDEAHIINLSLGGGPTDGNDPMSRAVDKAVEDGLVVAVAAGNSGSSYYTVDTPGAARKAITVGAVNAADALAYFSSRGPTTDIRVKPDVLAPGVSINSAIPGGGYGTKSGTSMSTPHVAGAAALLLQASTSLLPKPAGWDNNRYVKTALINTAKDLGLNVYQQGAGRINVASAAFTPILINDANNSLGKLAGPVSVSYTILNRSTAAVTLNFAGELKEMVSGMDWSARVWFTPSSLTIPGLGTASMTMTVNASGLPPDLVFSGKIAAASGASTWRAIFGFHTMKVVTLHKMPRDMGGSVEGDFFLLWNDSSPSWIQWGAFDALGYATAFAPSGTYQIFTEGMASASPASYVAVIKENQVITSDTTIHLDEATAYPITLNPNKAGQKLAELYSEIEWDGVSFNILFGNLFYYPDSWTLYMSSTTWNSWSAYAYYPSASYNSADPDLVNAPEWHRLFYSRDSVSGPITYNVDYTRLAKRHTFYRVDKRSDLRASRWDFVFDPIAWTNWTFVWDMTAPQSRDEWLSPIPAYYLWGSYEGPFSAGEPAGIWNFETWYKQEYATGAGTADTLSWSMGSHPFRPGYSSFYVSTGYWSIDGSLAADRLRNYFSSDVMPEGREPGHIDIWRDGAPDGSLDVNYWYGIWRMFGGTPQYRVLITATSPLNLSTHSVTDMTFRPNPPPADAEPPRPMITANWDGQPTPADLKNRVPAGNIVMRLSLLDISPLSAITPPWLKWSTDALTWNEAALSVVASAPQMASQPSEREISIMQMNEYVYQFTLSNVPADTYLSFWTRAEDNAGNRIDYKVIKGLYVKSTVADTTPPPTPTPLSPANGSTTGPTPTFSWSAVSDASPPVLYDLQVASQTSMASPLINKTNLPTNTYPLSLSESLSPGTWYWRVRARDSASPPNYSAWSSPLWSFNISGELFLLPFTAAFFSTIPDSYGVKLDVANARANMGSTPADTDDADVPDPPNPPAAPFIDIEFLVGLTTLQTDSRPLTGAPASATWDFRVKPTYDESGTLAVPVTLTWNLASVPFNYLLAIQDQANLSYTDLWTTPGYLYTGTDSLFRNFKFFAQENRPPLVTILYPNGGETVGGVVTVTALASDPDGAAPFNDKVVSMTFQYSANGGATWNSIGPGSLASGTPASGTWSASWNTLAIPEGPGYKVRAIASDTLGATAMDESDASFTIVHKITVSATWQIGWIMWGYPFNPDPNTNTGQLGDDFAPVFAFHYNAFTGVYDLTDVATPGWGYWTRINTVANIDMEGLPNSGPTFEIPLGPSWNQISNPYNSNIVWSAVSLRKDGIIKTLLEASAAGWVNQWLYSYNTAAGVYVTKGAADGVLEAMLGYWFKANQPGVTLIIPAP